MILISQRSYHCIREGVDVLGRRTYTWMITSVGSRSAKKDHSAVDTLHWALKRRCWMIETFLVRFTDRCVASLK